MCFLCAVCSLIYELSGGPISPGAKCLNDGDGHIGRRALPMEAFPSGFRRFELEESGVMMGATIQ